MISVVLATHNEEKNLPRCLASVKSFADEVIVVDGESVDETVKVAKKLGATVIQTTNKMIFHINKQLAMDQAHGELVLQLDADEVVDEELAKYIKHVHHEMKMGKADELPAAWWLRRRNWFLGSFLRKGGQYPDPVIRLYQNGKARLPQKDVHEQMTVDGDVGWAEGHLLHFGNPSFSVYLQKFDTYTTLKATQLAEQGVSHSFANAAKYLLWLPVVTFLSLFFRHKGFLDGVPGFVFAACSGLHHVVAYLKLWEKGVTKV